MNKSLTIKLKKKIELIQAYLSAVNWTLGSNQLTLQELEVLSYFVYFDQQYLQITDPNVRYELLFSTNVKKKIKQQFNLNTTKLETYITKLRKKGIITNNQLNKPFQLNFEKDVAQIVYTFSISTNNPTSYSVPTSPPITTVEPQAEYVTKPQVQQSTPTYVEPSLSDFKPSVNFDDFDDDYFKNLPKADFDEGHF